MSDKIGNLLGWFTGSIGRAMAAWLFIASPLLLILDAGYDSTGRYYIRPGPRAVFLYILILMMVLSLLVLARCVQINRRRRASTILAYVMQAVRMQLPIVPLLEAARSTERGELGREIARFRALLEDGVPLADSLAIAAPAVEQRTASLLAAAQHNGTLAETIDQLSREIGAEPSERVVDRAFRRSYLLVVAVVTLTVVTMIMVFVIPKFESIFRDFGTDLPGSTLALLWIARETAWISPILLLLPFVLLWICGSAVRDVFTPKPPRTPLRSLWDSIIWRLPVARTLAVDRGLADVCRVIADGLAAGRPAPDAIIDAAGPHLNCVLRKCVEQWASAVLSGATLGGGARAAGLPVLVPGMLVTAGSGNDAIDVFEFLHRHYAARFSRAAIVIDAMVGPLMTFAIAAVVLFVALSLLAPTISLIQSISAPARMEIRY